MRTPTRIAVFGALFSVGVAAAMLVAVAFCRPVAPLPMNPGAGASHGSVAHNVKR
jgi:hypothetical protein